MTLMNPYLDPPLRIELPTPFSMGTVNAYLFLEPEPVLVDCGMSTAANKEALTAALGEHQLTIQDLKKLIITHAHVDHAGAAGWIADNSDTEIWVSNLVYPWVVDLESMWVSRINFIENILKLGGLPPERAAPYLAYMRQIDQIWEAVPADRVVRFPIEGELTFGGRTWQTLYAPGHTQTQSCFYHADSKVLISADMLLPIVPLPVIEQLVGGRDDRVLGLPQYLISMERFASLDVDTVYPGHGAPFTEHRAIIDQQRARIAARRSECLRLVQDGVDSVHALTETMYSHYPAVARMTGFSMMIGYLDLLLEDRSIKREITSDGRWRFFINK